MKAIFTETMALSDAARGLTQQMVWWGRDVLHPGGNLLVRHGLSRTESPGLKGTSCYRMTWEGGHIELHGAVASWVSPGAKPGVVFCRGRARLELWTGQISPIPGGEHGSHGPATTRWRAALPLVRWIGQYERWVRDTQGVAWREACWRTIRRLPKGRPWLPPAAALRWWELAAVSQAPRARSLVLQETR